MECFPRPKAVGGATANEARVREVTVVERPPLAETGSGKPAGSTPWRGTTSRCVSLTGSKVQAAQSNGYSIKAASLLETKAAKRMTASVILSSKHWTRKQHRFFQVLDTKTIT